LPSSLIEDMGKMASELWTLRAVRQMAREALERGDVEQALRVLRAEVRPYDK